MMGANLVGMESGTGQLVGLSGASWLDWLVLDGRCTSKLLSDDTVQSVWLSVYVYYGYY